MNFTDSKVESSFGDIMVRTLNESDLDIHIQQIKKWTLREIANTVSDAEAKMIIKKNTKVTLFHKIIMFLVFKDNTLIGLFVVYSDNSISLKIREYKKPTFGLEVYFIESIEDSNIEISIKLLLGLIKSFKIRINTIYFLGKYYEKYIKHFSNNGFNILSLEYFKRKWKPHLNDTNIIIKNMQY